MTVTVLPEHWHKRRLLESPTAERTLAKCYERQGFTDTRVIASKREDHLNKRLARLICDDRGARLKRVYEVHFQTRRGHSEIRLVMTKRVDWKWLGYRAFLTAYRQAVPVPPVLGLRDGILYMEMISRPAVARAQKTTRQDRSEASAASSQHLRFETSSGSSGRPLRHQDSLQLMEKLLCRAHGRILTEMLSRPRLHKRLSKLSCPVPTLIDGWVAPSKRIIREQGLLKTEREHHGCGKAEPNMRDSRCDLADTIFSAQLSSELKPSDHDRTSDSKMCEKRPATHLPRHSVGFSPSCQKPRR